MASVTPRPPYSPEELAALYPDSLKLHLVHVLFRHGERTPVTVRFQEAGVPAYWPYCHAASRFTAAVLESKNEWSKLHFQRRLEAVGKHGKAIPAKGPAGEVDDICLLGELTDCGRKSTLALGQRLRHLYIDQLGFLPKNLEHPAQCYLRSTSMTRTFESLQQVFTGLYPIPNRPSSVPTVIQTRFFNDENLFTGESSCPRLLQLVQAFASLAADKWNDSPEMHYLDNRIGKWVKGGVKVDGHPRLSGVMDSVNSTMAHGKEVKLPAEFYEPEVRRILETVNCDEWFRGYNQSSEYRRLGVGSILGDLRDRMLESTKRRNQGPGRLKIALMGCHDTTLAGILVSLGAFDQKWPPFTSSIAFEMFRSKENARNKGIVSRLLGGKNAGEEGWYVRLRYNDNPIIVKGCRAPGKHLKGDKSFCTLTAFKEIVEKIAPEDRRKECLINLDKPGIPPVEEM